MNDSEQKKVDETEAFIPPMPETVDETGLDFGVLADLTLKAVYSGTDCTSETIADKLKLPLGIAEELLQYLYREKLIEIRARINMQSNRYAMLDRGWERSQRLLELCGYIGPAPISLDYYMSAVRRM